MKKFGICFIIFLVVGCSGKEGVIVEEKEVLHVSAKSVSKEKEPVRPNVDSIDYFLPDNHSQERTEKITHLMIHFISNAANNPKDPYNVRDVNAIFLDYGLSVHYMIDRDGNIYQLVSEDRVAYHAGKGSLSGFPGYEDRMNEYSIGIELLAIGTKEEMTAIIPEEKFVQIDPSLQGYTDAQYKTLRLLVDDILKRNPSILQDRRHVIGHDEYALDRKTDPGSLFDWTQIGF
ncbi:N-acetylmuramoyl-L-alanine amidase [Fredinandcohnia sp. 179-A 10B2 NHS]|uniref:N-acetylmuramoyl-L-alanine amidase n=1 Tax=Fredinandcohnia sp. 179-A 10B2 NHS TaxID=3235176 RepID=UPI0039A0393C